MKIFENAKFGDKFRTRDDRKAIYIKNLSDCIYHHQMVLDNGDIEVYDNFGKRSYGCTGLDIVSEWQEPINEEELDKTAEIIVDTFLFSDYTQGRISYGQLKDLIKASYRKAKQE